MHKKILFALTQDDDGYPPMDVEGVWAIEADDGGYEIDNIPFFASQATVGDIIEAKSVDDRLFYEGTRRPSKHSLLRVALFDGRDPAPLRSKLAKLGCSTEQSHLACLIAVDVPPNVSLDEVRALLDDGCDRGFWDYEEPILRR